MPVLYSLNFILCKKYYYRTLNVNVLFIDLLASSQCGLTANAFLDWSAPNTQKEFYTDAHEAKP